MSLALQPGVEGFEHFAIRVHPETHRVEYATYEAYSMPDDPKVDSLPDGDIIDYLYINGQFVYSPLPPEYPLCEQDAEMGKIFMIDDEIYKARTAIGKGEPVTPYNSEKITPADLLNALAEQRGE